LFVIAQAEFGGLDLALIKENSIEIFQGYQGQIFALGLRKLIVKEYESEGLVEYLRYAMRLLHFIRELKLAANPPKRKYFSP
jgi:hypothetical protein